MKICEECFSKQQKIDKLEEEIDRLKGYLNYQERVKEKPFGSSTPSSKILHKGCSCEENQKNQGGAKKGHKGYGRESISKEDADEIIEIESPEFCPECGEKLNGPGEIERTVKDIPDMEVKTVLYRIKRAYCNHCKKTVTGRKIPALSNSLIGNQLLAHTVEQHYLVGTPLNRLAEQSGISLGTVIGSLHRLRELLKPVMDRLIEEYRNSAVKHADETSWRNNGSNGYAWLFSSPDTAIFRLRKTRSGQIAHEALGDKRLPGVLVVDRYNGYNKAPCDIQYCQAHLLREIQYLGKDFPEEKEVQGFVETAASLVGETMSLRNEITKDEEFLTAAQKLRTEIESVMNSDAQHPGIRKIQDIYRRHADRMYHWAKDKNIPADNNFAERELRNLVIARKVSFGSQSDEGALTRETLMSILHTMRLRGLPVRERFKKVLDELADNSQVDKYALLFSADTC